MYNDEINRDVAHDWIDQLRKSERGRGALYALALFLQDDDTFSLDSLNQEAVIALVTLAMLTPSVRELIADAANLSTEDAQ